MVATAVTGFVIDAMRKIVSRVIRVGSPNVLTPSVSMCVSPRLLTSVTIPHFAVAYVARHAVVHTQKASLGETASFA